MRPFDETGRSFRYEIGKKRYDGKFNVWHRIEMLPQQYEWVIVFVAHSWKEAMRWIDKTEREEALAA